MIKIHPNDKSIGLSFYEVCKDNPPCSSHKRNDGNDVIFKELP